MNLPHAYGLLPKIIEQITSIINNHPVEEIILYGSRAKGNFKPGSDIDLTLVAPKLTTTDLLKIENELEELNLPYKIDLSIFHQIENQSLIDHICRIGIKLKPK